MRENRTRWLTVAALLLVLASVVGFWRFGGRYGDVSAEGYEFATSLYSACNRRDEAALHKISELVAVCRQSGELRPAEAKWLSSIIDKGLAGDWDNASRGVRRLLEDQVSRAASLPEA